MLVLEPSVRTLGRPGMVLHAFNPCTWESEAGRFLFEFKASLVYLVSSKLLELHSRTLSLKQNKINQQKPLGHFIDFISVQVNSMVKL